MSGSIYLQEFQVAPARSSKPWLLALRIIAEGDHRRGKKPANFSCLRDFQVDHTNAFTNELHHALKLPASQRKRLLERANDLSLRANEIKRQTKLQHVTVRLQRTRQHVPTLPPEDSHRPTLLLLRCTVNDKSDMQQVNRLFGQFHQNSTERDGFLFTPSHTPSSGMCVYVSPRALSWQVQ